MNQKVFEEYEAYKDRRDQEWEDAKELAPITTDYDPLVDYFESYMAFQKKLWRGDVR